MKEFLKCFYDVILGWTVIILGYILPGNVWFSPLWWLGIIFISINTFASIDVYRKGYEDYFRFLTQESNLTKKEYSHKWLCKRLGNIANIFLVVIVGILWYISVFHFELYDNINPYEIGLRISCLSVLLIWTTIHTLESIDMTNMWIKNNK